MYRLIGSDGKEYGPISADQLRQWIGEGRAGGSTRIRREGEAEWSLLNSVPEFAEQFHTPPLVEGRFPGDSLPTTVRLFAFGFFLAAAINGALVVLGIFNVLRAASSNGGFHPGLLSIFLWAFSFLGPPIRIVSGVGVLRRQDWARILAIIYAAVATVVGVVGLIQAFNILLRLGDLSGILRSPAYVLSNLWAVAVLAFNVATIVVFARPAVRASFKSNARNL